jgi:ABC-type nitrate/sulfonate/bicarbonate transport system substrate-binding protein
MKYKLCLILLVAVLLVLSSCKERQAQTRLRFGIIKPSIDYLPLTVAFANQYLDLADIDVISFSSGWEIQEAITAGKLDLAIMPFSYAWTAISKGYKLKIVSCLERETDGIVTSTKYQDLAQLQGKKIGLLRASTIEGLMQRTAEMQGFSYNPVYFRTPMEMMAALQTKEVEAIVCYVPLIQKLSNDYKVLYWFSTAFPAHPCCDVIASDAILSKRHKEVKAVVSALQKASNDINEPTDAIMQTLYSVYGLDSLQAIEALRHTKFDVTISESDKEFERRMMEFFLKNEYLNHIPAMEQVYYK